MVNRYFLILLIAIQANFTLSGQYSVQSKLIADDIVSKLLYLCSGTIPSSGWNSKRNEMRYFNQCRSNGGASNINENTYFAYLKAKAPEISTKDIETTSNTIESLLCSLEQDYSASSFCSVTYCHNYYRDVVDFHVRPFNRALSRYKKDNKDLSIREIAIPGEEIVHVDG